MPFTIQHGDITQCHVDAIVNAANNTLLGGGGVDGAIHRAAGPQLLEYCRTLGGVETGKAKITPGFDLPAKYVIHTAGPIWQGGGYHEKELLESSYRSALQLAEENGCETLAFPLISAGAYGYPKEEALAVAKETILEYLEEHEMSVFLLLYEKEGYPRPKELDQRLLYLLERNSSPALSGTFPKAEKKRADAIGIWGNITQGMPFLSEQEDEAVEASEGEAELTLEERLKYLDESFSRSLLRIIDEKGMKDSDCYKRANLTRQHFSKIRSNDSYHPTKETALSLCIALQLSVPESEALLAKAGYAFSPSDSRDIVVRYYLEKGNTDIFTINGILLSLDLKLLSVVA